MAIAQRKPGPSEKQQISPQKLEKPTVHLSYSSHQSYHCQLMGKGKLSTVKTGFNELMATKRALQKIMKEFFRMMRKTNTSFVPSRRMKYSRCLDKRRTRKH